MLIPIGTDVRTRRVPIGNWLLVAMNVGIFLVLDVLLGSPEIKREFMLNAATPSLGQYISYQFLHGDFVHLAGNMLFLWIFGNAVCDRMGSLPYVLFYLAGGVFAGMVFASRSENPMLGASGSIAAVTTAFLVLYPRVHITVLLWMIIVTTFQVPAMILIVIKIILWDNVIAPSLDRTAMSQQIAFSAHLGGYAFGFLVPLLLLLVGALPRNQFDLLAVYKRWRQRANWTDDLRGAARDAARPWRGAPGPHADDEPPLSPLARQRENVLDRLAEHDLVEASRLYLQLAALAPGATLPRQQQLDIANYLAQQARHREAAHAYEAYLDAYPAAPDAAKVHLMLGLIYNRYLHAHDKAVAHLRAALDGIDFESQRSLALGELREAMGHVANTGGGPAC
ncbi:MAG: rhomboid family intramembrane serine protease [Phycisphaerae bacterium]|nr:rhomboid family intramembrane serine protease [Phycisphaerae bacterium]MCZ2401064.1 rhomboid family intramembrane serine protease [Phycisphaerae bacterium]